MDTIVGTAGHIDHGKTALVKALTGIDADRLPEEKQRGITIDLGFAEMDGGDVRIGFVDVPGHERFVKNMLAGASGIDVVLLVIAADEGVMPQTREHFDICRLLRIKSGVIVLTKMELADAETRALARLDVAELVQNSFLETAPVFLVSSRTGEGIAELKEGLLASAKAVQRESDVFETRLPIDRSFSVKGFGAVVTGTLMSGEIGDGDELELMPAGRTLRVRGVQTHGNTVGRVYPGQRTAVNVAGIGHDEITRGMVLAAPGVLSVTQSIDAEVEVLTDAPRGLRSRQRVRVHLGTAEVLARVSVLNDAQIIEPGSRGFAQLRLESPVAAALGLRLIIRSYSPQRTIAGARVLDAVAKRHRRSGLSNVTTTLGELSDAADGSANAAEIIVRMSGVRGVRRLHLRSRTSMRNDVIDQLVDDSKREGTVIDADGVLVSKPVYDHLRMAMLSAVEAHHNKDKLSRGMQRETLREQVFKHAEPELFRAVTRSLESDGKITTEQDVIKLASHETSLSPEQTIVRDRLRAIYANAGLEVPKLDDALQEAASGTGLDQRAARKVFQVEVDKKEVVAVTNEYYFSTAALDELVAKLRASTDRTIDVSKFKEMAGVSRKYAIPLLEYFDRTRVTRRVGDKREIV